MAGHMTQQNMPPTGAPPINVRCDDYLIIPTVKNMTRVTIGWLQDRSTKDTAFETIPRSADYYRCYGYNVSAADKPEILIFIAVELLTDEYKGRAPLYLEHQKDEVGDSSSKVKIQTRGGQNSE